MMKNHPIIILFLIAIFLGTIEPTAETQTCLKPFTTLDTFQEPSRDLGTEIVLPRAEVGGFSPGFYFPLALPGSVGGNDYHDNITNCATVQVNPGDHFFLEPGNKVGPTSQGLNDLIASDPEAVWDPVTNRVVNSRDPQSPRIGAIALYGETLDGDKKGRNTVFKVNRILGVFFEPSDEAGTIKGRIAPICGDGDCNGEWEENPASCPADCENACNTPEATLATCFDEIDNDCDSQLDCDDPDCIFVCAAAVAVNVTPAELTSAVGENTLYVITVTNGGPNVTRATVTDTVRIGSTVVYAGPPLNGPPDNNFTCQVNLNDIVCTGDVAASTSADIVIVKQYQAPGDFTDFINLSATSDSTPNDNFATVTTIVVPGADVNVEVRTATGGLDFNVGQDVVYVMNLLNAGPASTTVTLTDSVFLIGSTVISAQIIGGDLCEVDQGSQMITCSLNMPPSTSADIVVVKQYAFPEVYDEFIEAVSSTKDPNLDNNSVTLSLNISP